MTRVTRMLAALALASLSCAGGAPAVPDAAPLTPLAQELEVVRAAHGLPSLAGAVVTSDGLIALDAVGVRKLGDPTPVTRDDVWHLGSDTKAMTATLIALAVKDGTLRWDTTMAEAFPAEAASFAPAYRGVTVEMLLDHRGGAPAAVPSDIWSDMWKPGDPRAQRRAAVIAMLQRAPETPPGTAFVYANAGYMMAGAALEDAAGASWDDLMRARIFAPLAMASCGFGPPASPGRVDQPWGHTSAGVPVDPAGGVADNPPSLGPAGTVHCSMTDWGKFVTAHLRGARGLTTPLGLDATEFARLHTPPAGADYAFGWVVTTRPWADGTTFTHSGSNTMFYVTGWIAPARDRAFLAATNIGGDAAAAGVDAAFGPLIAGFN
jgi:CubicO group peptidase (beta-lactamase class C family)